MCMRYLHDGKKEKSGIRRIYIFKKKNESDFMMQRTCLVGYVQYSCLMAPAKSRTRPVVLFFRGQIEISMKKFDAYNTIDFSFHHIPKNVHRG